MWDKILVDGHTHLGEDRDGKHSQTTSSIMNHLRRYGFNKAVTFPLNETDPGTPTEASRFNKPKVSFWKANDRIANAVSRYPDNLIGFFRLDPNDNATEIVKEIHRCVKELGLVGLKLHPRSQDFNISDEIVKTIVHETSSMHCPILFHTQGEKEVRDLTGLAKQVPEARLIMGHAGMGALNFALDDCKDLPNVMFETSVNSTESIVKMINDLGVHRVVFGTDSPLCEDFLSIDLQKQIKSILDMGDKVSSLVLGGNVMRIMSADRSEIPPSIREDGMSSSIRPSAHGSVSPLIQEVGLAAVVNSTDSVDLVRSRFIQAHTSELEGVRKSEYVHKQTGLVSSTEIILELQRGSYRFTVIASDLANRVYIFVPAFVPYCLVKRPLDLLCPSYEDDRIIVLDKLHSLDRLSGCGDAVETLRSIAASIAPDFLIKKFYRAIY